MNLSILNSLKYNNILCNKQFSKKCNINYTYCIYLRVKRDQHANTYIEHTIYMYARVD